MDHGQTCSACEGVGWYYVGDWKAGYPKGTCRVCEGSGRMRPDRKRGLGHWLPAAKKGR